MANNVTSCQKRSTKALKKSKQLTLIKKNRRSLGQRNRHLLNICKGQVYIECCQVNPYVQRAQNMQAKNCSTQSCCYQNTQYSHNFQGRAIEINQRLLITLRGKALQDKINVPIYSFWPKTGLMWGFRKWFQMLKNWRFLRRNVFQGPFFFLFRFSSCSAAIFAPILMEFWLQG